MSCKSIFVHLLSDEAKKEKNIYTICRSPLGSNIVSDDATDQNGAFSRSFLIREHEFNNMGIS